MSNLDWDEGACGKMNRSGEQKFRLGLRVKSLSNCPAQEGSQLYVKVKRYGWAPWKVQEKRTGLKKCTHRVVNWDWEEFEFDCAIYLIGSQDSSADTEKSRDELHKKQPANGRLKISVCQESGKRRKDVVYGFQTIDLVDWFAENPGDPRCKAPWPSLVVLSRFLPSSSSDTVPS